MTTGSTGSIARSLLLQSDGKAVIAGSLMMSDGGRDLFAARLDGAGSLDTGFGAGGVGRTAIAPTDDGFAAARAADGSIIVVGSYQVPSEYPLAVRFTAAGALDATFAGDGIKDPVVAAPGRLQSVALLADGRIVAC